MSAGGTGPQPGDTVGIPPEPAVGSRLRMTGVEEQATDYEHLDVIHRPEGWYYAGFLTPDGEPAQGPAEELLQAWGWDYIVGTHKNLTYIVVGDGTWKGLPS